MVRDNIARDCAQVWCGEGEQEVLAIEFSRLEPKLVVIASYGVQANSFGAGVQEANMLEIMGKMAEWKEEGFNIVYSNLLDCGNCGERTHGIRGNYTEQLRLETMHMH